MSKKPILLIFFALALMQHCVEPFYPDITNYENVFVVDGLITNEIKPYIIKLSRTLSYSENTEKPVTKAEVNIEDNEGNIFRLTETSKGTYKSNPAELVGEIGKSYRLLVKTENGDKFESEFEKLKPVPEIEELTWELTSYETEDRIKHHGVQFYLNTQSAEYNTRYYAWEYRETWSVQAPFTSNKINTICWHDILHENGWTNMQTGDYFLVDSSYEPVNPVIENNVIIKEGFDSLVVDTIYYCWNWDPSNFSWGYNSLWRFYLPPDVGNLPTKCWITDSSENIIIATTDHLQKDFVSQQPILLVSDATNRLNVRYSLEVIQFSLSENAYTYWSNLQRINSNTGSLFDPTPTSVPGNITNITDPDQPVLGYFQASSTTSKRIFVDRTELPGTMKISSGFEACESVEITSPDEYVQYLQQGYVIIDHFFYNNFYRSVVTNYLYCTDCSSMGSAVRPDFWDDFK